MTMRDAVAGMIFAFVGALVALPFSAARYEEANALSCCENPSGDGYVIGIIIIGVAVIRLWPAMAWFSENLHAVVVPVRGLLLTFIGTGVGAALGWALFQFLLLPSDLDGTAFGSWGLAPGALVGALAAVGWFFGSEILVRFKKVKNG